MGPRDFLLLFSPSFSGGLLFYFPSSSRASEKVNTPFPLLLFSFLGGTLSLLTFRKSELPRLREEVGGKGFDNMSRQKLSLETLLSEGLANSSARNSSLEGERENRGYISGIGTAKKKKREKKLHVCSVRTPLEVFSRKSPYSAFRCQERWNYSHHNLKKHASLTSGGEIRFLFAKSFLFPTGKFGPKNMQKGSSPITSHLSNNFCTLPPILFSVILYIQSSSLFLIPPISIPLHISMAQPNQLLFFLLFSTFLFRPIS